MEHFPGAPHESESKNTETDKNGTRRRRDGLGLDGLARFAAEHNKKDAETDTPKSKRPGTPRLFSLIERPDGDTKPDVPAKRPEDRDTQPPRAEILQPTADEAGNANERSDAESADNWSARAAHEAEADAKQSKQDAFAAEQPGRDDLSAAVPEHTVIASQEDYDQWAERELRPNELYGGEIIDLEGPGTEQVIDLHVSSAETVQPVIETVAPSRSDTEPITSEQIAFTQQQTSRPTYESPVLAAEAPYAQPAPEAARHWDAAAERPRTEQQYPAAEVSAHEAQPTMEAPQEYASVVPSGPERTARPVSGAAEQPATKREVDNAVYRATRAGIGRGLATGLLIGGVYEHRKHKRREKKQHKKMERQAKQLNQARSEYKFTTAQQSLREAATTRQMNAAEQRYQHSQFESKQQLQQQARHYEARLANAGPGSSSMEQARFTASSAGPERQPNGATNSPEQRAAQPRTNEQLGAPGEGYLQVPEGHRIDTSGAFIAELDKTGKLAETSAIAHYQEFYRELAQEAGPQAQRNAAAGEIALVAAATTVSDKKDAQNPNQANAKQYPAAVQSQSGNGVAPVGSLPFTIPSATSKGAPVAARPSSAAVSDAPDQSGQSPVQTQKPLWPLVVTLVAIVIVILFLAR